MEKHYIEINSMNYEIRFVPPLDNQLNFGKLAGTCDYINKVIYISNDLEKRMFKVFVHELTHAYIYEYSQKNYDDKETWTDEDLCVFMENYGIQIIRQADLNFDNLIQLKERKIV